MRFKVKIGKKQCNLFSIWVPLDFLPLIPFKNFCIRPSILNVDRNDGHLYWSSQWFLSLISEYFMKLEKEIQLGYKVTDMKELGLDEGCEAWDGELNLMFLEL